MAQLFIGEDLDPDNAGEWGVARCGKYHSVINPYPAGVLFIQLGVHEIGHNFAGTHDAPNDTSCGVDYQAGPLVPGSNRDCIEAPCNSIMTKGTTNNLILMFTNDPNGLNNVGKNINPNAQDKYLSVT